MNSYPVNSPSASCPRTGNTASGATTARPSGMVLLTRFLLRSLAGHLARTQQERTRKKVRRLRFYELGNNLLTAEIRFSLPSAFAATSAESSLRRFHTE